MPADRNAPTYTVGFLTLLCMVCALAVSASAVWLRPRQEQNRRVDRLQQVLRVAGLASPHESLTPAQVEERFQAHVIPRTLDLPTGSVVAYEVTSGTSVTSGTITASPQRFVLPLKGPGLWSMMHGYLALESDASTVAGIVFYDHAETPGLGAEIESPRWQQRWIGRKVFDGEGNLRLRVIKGRAGTPADDPHQVDGISGATITARGVSDALATWLGAKGFGPYLDGHRSAPRAEAPP